MRLFFIQPAMNGGSTMPTKSKSTKRRTKVAEIQQQAKALSKGEQKKVKGGFTGGVFVAAGDVNNDGLRKPTNIQDGTSNTRKAP